MTKATSVVMPAPLGTSSDSSPSSEARRVHSISLPLLDRVLREQQELTAVERFSQRHDEAESDAQARYYRDLLPATAPGPGQQYAFEVDLDRCSGCKACVAACHSLNGLDEGESFRIVGLLHGGTSATPVQQTVTTACHHCLDPACMNGCPVKAYEKDPVTGIVKHLDDQCIGCQYCTLTCPYEVPKYNARLGIVRKCDMCSDRLKEGEAPACVRSCPNEAIAIRVVDTRAVLEDVQTGSLVPGAPSSGITAPTTTYKTRRAAPRNLLPADFYSVHPAHQHRPLVAMLVLTQLSVGAFCVDQLLSRVLPETSSGLLRPLQALVALGLGLVALGASTAHLGRPLYAFRAILGVRTSWLSREILAFGAFAGLAAADAAVVWLASGKVRALPFPLPLQAMERTFGLAVAVAGIVGVFCSVMLYHVTRKTFWGGARTGFKFFFTAAILGVATTAWTSSIGPLLQGHADQEYLPLMATLSHLVLGLVAIKLIGEATLFLNLRDKQQSDLKRSALLMTGELSRWTAVRFGAAVLGALSLPFALASLEPGSAPAIPLFVATTSALILLLTGELLERALFFSAVASPRMPGGLS